MKLLTRDVPHKPSWLLEQLEQGARVLVEDRFLLCGVTPPVLEAALCAI